MISVMNEREIETNPAGAADPTFFGMENPRPGARVFDAAAGSGPRVPIELDLEAGVSEDGEQGRIRSPDSVEMIMDDGRVAESDSWREGSEDDHLESPRPEIRAYRESSGNWMHGFKTGDMVWGKVKSHPWWPGHIFNESFASPSVRRTRREGHVLVAFFGDSSYGWFEPAELIPFEPHFTEKSRQTTSRTFVKAVEEAVDEVSRRAALGLACCCRNQNNFRPTAYQECFAVDVVGFELSGLYSSQQIKRARDGFVAGEVLSFVKQLAVVPQAAEEKTVDWIRSMSMMLAYRKAVFEEFDETYAQAFGVQPVRPTQNSMGVSDQPDRFAPRAAPLSGPLVIAEALGKKKSSTSSSFSGKSATKPAKVSSSKKNKYVLKRRDELPTTTSSLPDLPPVPQPHQPVTIPSAHQTRRPTFIHPSPPPDPSYVFQKREDIKAEDEKGMSMPAPSMPCPRSVDASGAQTASYDSKPKLELPPPGFAEKPDTVLGFETSQPKTEMPTPLPIDSKAESREGKAVDGVVKKKKKRPREEQPGRPDPGTGEVAMKKKKKKKKDVASIGLDHPPIPKEGAGGDAQQMKAHYPEVALRPEAPALPSKLPHSVLQPDLDLSSLELELPLVLGDLSAVALDPFHGIERGAPSIVHNVFLKFRNMVYQKSLVIPPPMELETREELGDGKPTAAVVPETREQKEPASTSKPVKHSSSRPDDPTKAGRKRPPSDRQEEKSAKRLKKLNKVKSLASEKKAAISGSQKSAEGQLSKPQPQQPPKPSQQRDSKETSTTAKTAPMASKPSTSETPVKKQEPLLPLPPKKESPTFLVLYFPPRSTLPLIASLKAKFARFGPIDHPFTRVLWKSHSCKVLFKYRSDAQAACNAAKNNNLFGQIQVNCHLRDHEGSSSGAKEPAPEPSKRRADVLPPGNGGGSSSIMAPMRSSSFQQRQQQQGQLKSILKKPNDESGTNGNGAGRENRVKFLLSDEDRKPESPLAMVGGSVFDGSPSPSLPLPPPLEPVSRTPRSVSFLPSSQVPHPMPLRAPPQYASRPIETHRFPPPPLPPSIPPQMQLQLPLRPHPPSQPSVGDGFESRRQVPQLSEGQLRQHAQQYGVERKSRSNVDISHQLMSLLLKCNDIVVGLNSLPGYVPYSPL